MSASPLPTLSLCLVIFLSVVCLVSVTNAQSLVFINKRIETKFHVKPLPHARIPIVKLSLDPSPGLPSGIACDIGFENRLALENTRLLMCYAMIDPTRVRTLVLFRKSAYTPLVPRILNRNIVKVWSKRRWVLELLQSIRLFTSFSTQKNQLAIPRHTVFLRLCSSSHIFFYSCQEPPGTSKSSADAAITPNLPGTYRAMT